MRYQRAETPARLDGHEAARRFFAHCFDDSAPAGEQLWVAHVDAQARCLALTSHPGTVDSVEIPVGQVIRDAARLGSAGVVIAHNHPSGDSAPSRDDCRATRKLAAAAEAIDLTVIDHLIFGRDNCSSFRRMGLL